MNYNLNDIPKDSRSYFKRLFDSFKGLSAYIDKKKMFLAIFLVLISSIAQIVTPYLLGSAIDKYIAPGNLRGLGSLILIVGVLYVITALTSYAQQIIMGNVGQDALFKLRSVIFEKIQSLPIGFFNQNKVGDLMSRINNDTDKLSQFLSESILRFAGSFATLLGIAGFVLYINLKLGASLLSTTIILFVITRIISPFLEQANKKSSQSVGAFTSGVQENLTNFKAIVAFDRRTYFEENLNSLATNAYKASMWAGFGNNVLSPVYDFGGYIAQLVVLVYGIYLTTHGQMTIGILIGFLTYAIRFYDPLRFMATIFSNIQVSLASWSRIQDILKMTSDLIQVPESDETKAKMTHSDKEIMCFDHVTFGYKDDQKIINDACLMLEKGKTYALVGPTGGGKSTLASLMARLYDPVSGTIFLKSKDIRSYSTEEKSKLVSLILQEPLMFEGTIADNIRYGNSEFEGMNDDNLMSHFHEKGMKELIGRFQEGLATKVDVGGENISLGQKQLISFLRIILRQPELLILDEATANIDTVTESMLQHMIDSLPESTTKVIIAHRLNTIQKADQIFFINGGSIEKAKSFEEVASMIQQAKRTS